MASRPAATEPLHEHLVLSTSGSTGEPGIFVYTRTELALWVGERPLSDLPEDVAPGAAAADLAYLILEQPLGDEEIEEQALSAVRTPAHTHSLAGGIAG